MLKRLCIPVILLLLPILGTAPAMSSVAAENPPEKQLCMILLHGLWRSSLSMKHMQWGLEKAGYQVVNEGYPSSTLPIQALAPLAVEVGLAGAC